MESSEFNSNLKNCLKKQLEKEKATVETDNESLSYQIPFSISLVSTETNLFSRLFRYGKGRIQWKIESNLIRYNYLISLKPIVLSSFMITALIALVLLLSDNFSSYYLIRNSIVLFIILFLIGLAISKVRLSSLIKDCISENLRNI